MNKMFFIPAICAAFLLTSCGGSSKVEDSGKVAEASAAALTYEIDSASSNVAWLAKKVTGQHSGTVAIKSGKLQADSGVISAGNFVLDMTSVAVTDNSLVLLFVLLVKCDDSIEVLVAYVVVVVFDEDNKLDIFESSSSQSSSL